MIKKPSIHLYTKDLELLLKESGLSKPQLEKTMTHIKFNSAKYPVHRTLVITNNVTKKKLERAAVGSVQVFNDVLSACRMKKSHKFSRIKSEDKDWLLLCDVTKQAVEFCEIFDLAYKRGFKIYVNTFFVIVGKRYSLNKFKTYKDKIITQYERKLVVQNDDNPEVTNNCVQYFLEKSGIELLENAQKIFELNAHHFVYCSEQLLEQKAEYTNWIDAQFDGLAYLDTLPTPLQLHGQGALDRYLNTVGKKQTWEDGFK